MTCPSCGTIAAEGLERCKRCGSALALPEHQPDFPVPVLRSPTRRGEAAQRAAGIVPQVLATPSPPRPAPGPQPAPGPLPGTAPGDGSLGPTPAGLPGWSATGAMPPPPEPAAVGPTYNTGSPPAPAGAGRPAQAQQPLPHEPIRPVGDVAPAVDRSVPARSAPSEPVFAVPPPPPVIDAGPAPADGPTPPLPPQASPSPFDTTLAHPVAAPDPTGQIPGVPADATRPLHADATRVGGLADRGGADGGREEARGREERHRDREERQGRLEAPWPPPPGPWSGHRSANES